MPKIEINGVSTHYEDRGSGTEAVVFAHGLLWSGKMFDDQVAALKDRYRCIVFDFRVGAKRKSPAPATTLKPCIATPLSCLKG